MVICIPYAVCAKCLIKILLNSFYSILNPSYIISLALVQLLIPHILNEDK